MLAYKRLGDEETRSTYLELLCEARQWFALANETTPAPINITIDTRGMVGGNSQEMAAEIAKMIKDAQGAKR